MTGSTPVYGIHPFEHVILRRLVPMFGTHEPGVTRELARNLIADLDQLTLNPQKSNGVKAQLCFGFCLFAVRQVLQKINPPRSSFGPGSELAVHW
jgi:hypothetical protein